MRQIQYRQACRDKIGQNDLNTSALPFTIFAEPPLDRGLAVIIGYPGFSAFPCPFWSTLQNTSGTYRMVSGFFSVCFFGGNGSLETAVLEMPRRVSLKSVARYSLPDNRHKTVYSQRQTWPSCESPNKLQKKISNRPISSEIVINITCNLVFPGQNSSTRKRRRRNKSRHPSHVCWRRDNKHSACCINYVAPFLVGYLAGCWREPIRALLPIPEAAPELAELESLFPSVFAPRFKR